MCSNLGTDTGREMCPSEWYPLIALFLSTLSPLAILTSVKLGTSYGRPDGF
jgi:hypothetical protein